jgi:hypothetical protein
LIYIFQHTGDGKVCYFIKGENMQAVFIGIGILIGGALTILIFRLFMIGKLKVISSDPDSSPYLFLELSKSMKFVKNVKYVILKVDDGILITRK